METRHPAEDQLCSELCSYDGLELQDLEILWAFLRFLEKRPITVKLSKFCSESLHGDTDWRCCVQRS